MGELSSSVAAHDAAVAVVAAWTAEALEFVRPNKPTDTNTTSSSTATATTTTTHPTMAAVYVAAEEFTTACIHRGITHATAVACTHVWIQDALTHHHHHTLPAPDAAATVPSPVHRPATTPVVAVVERPQQQIATGDADVDALRSLATTIAAHAVHHALHQVTTQMQLLQVVETMEKATDAAVATHGTTTQEQLPFDQETQNEQIQDVESFSSRDETQSHHSTDAHTEAARRYVSSLVDSTLLRHVFHPSQSANASTESITTTISTTTTTTPTTTTRTPSLPQLPRTPTPPPAPKPKSPPREILVVPIETTETSVGAVMALAAVKPPMSGLRSRSQNKKTTTMHTKANSPPKTADAQLVSKPVAVGPRRRAPPRPSKQPTAATVATAIVDQNGDEVSPPRLRKLEEYLAMDPVDRATEIYHRPHAPRHNQQQLKQQQKQQPKQQKQQQQLPSLYQTRSPTSGYDAESDDDDDDDHDDDDQADDDGDQSKHPVVHNSRSLTKIRPAPVFPPATTTTSTKTSTTTRATTTSSTTVTRVPEAATNATRPPPPKHTAAATAVVVMVVDRPDRLGLLNKPKKRSGFCQQCTFQGKSCKISDCLKHQPLLLR